MVTDSIEAARRSQPLILIFVVAMVVFGASTPVPADAAVDRYMRLGGVTAYAKGTGTSMGTGNFEVVFWALAEDWSRRDRQVVFAKWNGIPGGNGMRIQFDTVGNLQLVVKDRDAVDHVYNAGEEFLDQQANRGRWYRIRFFSSLSDGTKSGIKVWESTASISTEVEDVNWGAMVAEDIRNGDAPLAPRTVWPWSVGARDRGASDPFIGKIAYAHFIPDGFSSQGLKPTVKVDSRYRWRASETDTPYDTWANAGTGDMSWKMVGARWDYVGGQSSGSGGGGFGMDLGSLEQAP